MPSGRRGPLAAAFALAVGLFRAVVRRLRRSRVPPARGDGEAADPADALTDLGGTPSRFVGLIEAAQEG